MNIALRSFLLLWPPNMGLGNPCPVRPFYPSEAEPVMNRDKPYHHGASVSDSSARIFLHRLDQAET
jgi:hypothetical protein